MIKKFAIGLFVIALIVGVGMYFVLSNLDGIVKTAIQRYGSAATQTAVRLDKVELDLKAGEAVLKGLRVKNPDGFTAPEAIKLARVRVSLDTASLRGSGPIHIREIAIDAPEVIFEHTPSGSNLEVLRKNAEAYAKRARGGEASTPPVKGPPASGGRTLVIDDIYLRDGQIAIVDSMVPGQMLQAKFPGLRISGLGKGKGGLKPAELGDALLEALTTAASLAATQEIARQTLDKAGAGALNDLLGK